MNNFPNTRYTFTMKENGRDLWSMEGQGPEYREMFAGMASAMSGHITRRDQPPVMSITVDGVGETHLALDADYNEVEERDHFVMTDINDIFDTFQLSWAGYATLQNGVWVLDKAEHIRQLDLPYHWISHDHGEFGRIVTLFRSPRFIQGIIMGYNALGIDFRTKMYGKPFTVATDGTITYYDIQGYPIVNPPDMPKRR